MALDSTVLPELDIKDEITWQVFVYVGVVSSAYQWTGSDLFYVEDEAKAVCEKLNSSGMKAKLVKLTTKSEIVS